MMERCAVILPAAGASRRMRGRDKLLEDVDGQALLRRQARMAQDVCRDVVVTVPAPQHPRVAALSDLDVTILVVADAANGMSASLRAGFAALNDDVTAAFVLPPDMPDLAADDLRRLWQTYNAKGGACLVQATTEDGVPGHPVLFPRACFADMATLSGDEGARSVVKAHQSRLHRVALAGQRARTDLDTPEAWDAWRAQT